ncbi:MAG TPA: hypothetical protein VFT31_10635 [Kribbella sp.]|jgi:hypothetical protein|nr:hypothetical protein [Kribbella sp.]
MTSDSRVLRYLAFSLMMVFAVVGSAFIIGETLADPGGTSGVLISLSWFAPMVALAVYALRRPETATKVLTVLAGVVALFVVLDAVLGIVPRDDVGPVGSIAVFAVAVVLGFLGLRRPFPAGLLLLLVGAANLAGAVATAGSEDGRPLGAALRGSSGAVAVPVLVIGGLFLLAALVEPERDRRKPPGTLKVPQA